MKQISERLKDENFWNPKQVMEYAEKSLQELEKRESKCMVKITDYIRKHYREQMLFCSLHHPLLPLLKELVKRIYSLMEPNEEFEFGEIALPIHYANERDIIYPSIQKGLGLQFKHDTCTRRPDFDKALNLEEWVERYIEIRYHTGEDVH